MTDNSIGLNTVDSKIGRFTSGALAGSATYGFARLFTSSRFDFEYVVSQSVKLQNALDENSRKYINHFVQMTPSDLDTRMRGGEASPALQALQQEKQEILSNLKRLKLEFHHTLLKRQLWAVGIALTAGLSAATFLYDKLFKR